MKSSREPANPRLVLPTRWQLLSIFVAARPVSTNLRRVPASMHPPNLTGHWVGFAALALFAAAYVLVIAEEAIHLRKSKPVVVAAGLM